MKKFFKSLGTLVVKGLVNGAVLAANHPDEVIAVANAIKAKQAAKK